MWEPMSSALAGRFLNTAPPGKSFFFFFFAASQDLWDLSSLPWIEPGTPAVKALLTTGSPGNSQVRTTLIRHFTVVVQFNP